MSLDLIQTKTFLLWGNSGSHRATVLLLSIWVLIFFLLDSLFSHYITKSLICMFPQRRLECMIINDMSLWCLGYPQWSIILAICVVCFFPKFWFSSSACSLIQCSCAYIYIKMPACWLLLLEIKEHRTHLHVMKTNILCVFPHWEKLKTYTENLQGRHKINGPIQKPFYSTQYIHCLTGRLSTWNQTH